MLTTNFPFNGQKKQKQLTSKCTLKTFVIYMKIDEIDAQKYIKNKRIYK